MAAFELLHLTDSVFSASRVLRRASERHGNEGIASGGAAPFSGSAHGLGKVREYEKRSRAYSGALSPRGRAVL